MAIVTEDSATNGLQLESIPLVDLRFLSQLELNSLSLCSDDAFDLRRCDDVVNPKIDRSVFNESAGSRKQTYSRLRLAPRKSEITSSVGRGRRCAGLLPIPKSPPNPVDDPERKENKRIVTLLREFFARDNSVTDLVLVDAEHGESLPVPMNVDNGVAVREIPVVRVDGERKKRGRKRKHEAKAGNDMSKAIVVYDNGLNAEARAMETVNRNGLVVDVDALANLEDPFGPELKKRTVGLQTEADFLGFLRGLNGLWGSRRRKRKIVDASDFGDALPIGWKLLLGLKRKEGRVWLNCRRYISPNGQQFVSCKEVSSFLLSCFKSQDASQRNSVHSDEKPHGAHNLASGSTAGLTYPDDSQKEDVICYSTPSITSRSNDNEKQVALLEVENLAEVHVRDLLECHKCNMTFEEKEAYLQHLLSSHQRSSKRCRLGSSIADGVIIKDGKYECQFCHKIFQERHRYNGHVGVHVRNYVRSLEVLPSAITMQKSIDPSSLNRVPSGISMDASVDLDNGSIPATSAAKLNSELNVGSSIQETSTGESNYEHYICSSRSKQLMEANKASIPEASTANFNDELNVKSVHGKLDVASIGETPTGGINYQRSVYSSHSKLVKEVHKDSILETSTTKLDDEQNVGSLHGKLDAASFQQTPTGESYYQLSVNSSNGKQAKEANKDPILETSTAKLDEQNVGSLHGKLVSASFQETPTGESNYELNANSPHKKQVTEANKDFIPETSTDKLDEQNVGSLHSILDATSIQETPTGESNYELNVGSSHSQQVTKASKTEETLVDESGGRYCDSKMPDDKFVMGGEGGNVIDTKISSCLDSGTSLSNYEEYCTPEIFYGKDGFLCTDIESDKYGVVQERCSEICSHTPGSEQICGVEDSINEVFSSATEEPKLDEVEKSGNNELGSRNCGVEGNTNGVIISTIEEPKLEEVEQSGNTELGSDLCGCHAEPGKDVVRENTRTPDEENVLQSGIADSSLPLMQSSGCFPTLGLISDKEEDGFCSVNEKLDNLPGFEELRFDDINPPEFSFMNGQESTSQPEESMDLMFDAELEQGLDSTVQFEWEAVLPKMTSEDQLTTVCVWCRIEFNHDAINSETQSDSVGFMCPTCKAKISGQLNVLDNDVSMNSDKL